MDIFIIKKNDLREKYRFLTVFLALSAFVYLKEGNTCHFLKLFRSQSQSYRYERIVSSGRTYSIQLIFNSLPSLIKLSSDFIQSIFNGTFLASAPVLI